MDGEIYSNTKAKSPTEILIHLIKLTIRVIQIILKYNIQMEFPVMYLSVNQ